MKKWMILGLGLLAAGKSMGETLVVSPDKTIKAQIYTNAAGQLCYQLKRGDALLMAESQLGLQIDGQPLGKQVKVNVGAPRIEQTAFDWLGNKNRVALRFKSQSFEVKEQESGRVWHLETKVFNDGFAFRYIIPSKESQFINGERTTWQVPDNPTIWHRADKQPYEGHWHKNWVKDLKNNYRSQLPVTLKMADGSYLAFTEAGGFTHSGLGLVYDGSATIRSAYGGDPKGWNVKGTIKTPWRVIMAGPTLNDLVNCDIVAAVVPAPNKKWFPKGSRTDWIRPGRSLWQWWGYWNPGTEWSKQRWFVDKAAELGCHYYMVDEGWEQKKQGWITEERTAWEALTELANYARTKKVRLLVWRSWYAKADKEWPGLETVEQRKEFFENCVKAGVYGVKIDFLGEDNVKMRTYVRDVLEEAAAYKLMVNFHGCGKPTGESRTYPNEITREGIRGMEQNKWTALTPMHYATSPFTRMLAGHGDFTPTTFQPGFIKGTTVTLQLATAIIYTSPIVHWADKPDVYLQSPAVDLIRTMPSTWDQTYVFPQSEIGELAAFARRQGNDWYIAVVNGGDKTTFNLDLGFLKKGPFKATIYEDVAGQPTKMNIRQESANANTKWAQEIHKGGGLVIVLKADR